MDSLNFDQQNFSIFGQENFIKGDFQLKGAIRISSFLEGHLKMQDQGKITIEPSGVFHGDIECYDIEIFGKIEGKINSKGNVIFQPGSRVDGQVEAEKISIYPGAIVNMQGETL